MDCSNFRELVQKVSSRYPNNIAFRMGYASEPFKELHFSEIRLHIHNYAATLNSLGFQKEYRLGLIADIRDSLCKLGTTVCGPEYEALREDRSGNLPPDQKIEQMIN